MDLGNVLRAVFNLSSLASLSNFDLSSLSIFGLILPLLSLAFSACSSLRLDSLTAPINILAASSALESISFPLDDDDSETCSLSTNCESSGGEVRFFGWGIGGPEIGAGGGR